MSVPLLDVLSPEDREQVVARARKRRFARDEIIFHEGDTADTLHIITAGRVAVRMTTLRGDVATLTVLGEGDTFGELGVVVETPERTASVAALEETRTLTLHKNDVDRLRETNPAIDRLFVETLASHVRRLSEQLQEAMFVQVDKRVLRRLLALSEIYDEGTISLSQAEIASLAGTSRPTANQALKDAEERGLIRIGRRRIEILDRDGLAKRAR